ncbi:hypothetical protein MP638_003951 [Amoeboaphelidium occidentale]|nr:hypothetical protein MP638_003951 [Amoeboaphelidium occidentale]
MEVLTKDQERHEEVMKSLLESFLETEYDRASIFQPNEGTSKNKIISDEVMNKIEMFLMQLSSCYQMYGCLIHILELNMVKVAEGFGIKAEFAVFPTFSLFSTENGNRKRKSHFFPSTMGTDLYKLQLVDELARKISSYGSESPIDKTMQPEAYQKMLDQATFLSKNVSNMPSPNPSLNGISRISKSSLLPRLVEETPVSAQTINQTILDLASHGPGIKMLKESSSKKYASLFSSIAVDDGILHLQTIMKSKPLYPFYANWLLRGLASASCCCLFFKGNFFDMAISFILGFSVGLIRELTTYVPTFGRIYEFASTFFVSLAAWAVHGFWEPICFKSVVMSSIINNLQGTMIATSIIDLLTKNMISGTVKLFFASVISAIIGYAMDLGTSAFARVSGMTKKDLIDSAVCGDDRAVEPYWYPLFFIIATLSFDTLVNAHYLQLPAMVFVAACSYSTYFFSSMVINVQIALILGTFVGSSLSNIYSRYTGHPAVIYYLPSLYLLVPGSMAVNGFFSFFVSDPAGGLTLAMGVITSAISLAIGVFAASSVFVLPELVEFYKHKEKPILQDDHITSRPSELML